MKQIIFVCTGNTCRSPMAEVIAKSLCKNSSLNIISRGIFVISDERANSNSIKVVKMQNLSLENHISKQITEEEIKNSTLILTMTYEHKKIICNKFEKYKNKVYTLCEYVNKNTKDIEDPYGMNLSEYILCYNKILKLIEKIDFDKI